MTKQNKFLWLAGIASIAMTTIVIYVPFLAHAFEFEQISLREYGIALFMAACIIPIVEVVKLIQRIISKRKEK